MIIIVTIGAEATNRCVFGARRNCPRLKSGCRRCTDRLFQSLRPAAAKQRSPRVICLDDRAFQDEKVKNLLSSAVNIGDLRRLNYNKTVFGRGFAPDPAAMTYDALLDNAGWGAYRTLVVMRLSNLWIRFDLIDLNYNIILAVNYILHKRFVCVATSRRTTVRVH